MATCSSGFLYASRPFLGCHHLKIEFNGEVTRNGADGFFRTPLMLQLHSTHTVYGCGAYAMMLLYANHNKHCLMPATIRLRELNHHSRTKKYSMGSTAVKWFFKHTSATLTFTSL